MHLLPARDAAPYRLSRSSGSAAPRAVPLVDDAVRRLAGRRFGMAPLRFVLSDGTVLWEPCGSAAVATVVFRDRLTLLDVLREPESRFGEAYVDGRVAVEGDLVAALEATYRSLASPRNRSRVAGAGHSIEAARHNVRRHYDLGNDFYRAWLDERMVYSCAYYASPEATLEEAQVAKMERVCRKLALQPGERVVEAGSGWGALALHMARHHGVRVTAFNVSTEQVRYARERAAAEGLDALVDFVEADYRCVSGRYDAFVSVGMLEHVGPRAYAELGALIQRCLDPERGRGLLHFIGRDRARPLNAWIRRWIFPGAYAPTLAEAVQGVFEPAGLAVFDVENLRSHYALTLGHWRERFERSAALVEARHGPRFTRAWRLYLAGSEAAFRTGDLELFQVVFGPSGADIRWARS
jgi:cyclopropane-fatty-acyl-phospholipid synthase